MNRWLTPQRLRYAWAMGVALWGAWFLNLALGSGLVDRAGQVIGTDYLQFYAAGTTLRIGESARLYDIAYQSWLEQTLIGPQLQAYHAFITPPFLAWLFVPLSILPYLASFIVWSVLSLGMLRLGMGWLGASPGRRFGWALTWLPVFSAISFGQNSLLSFFLLALVYFLWLKGYRWSAGLICSLLMYKPQLVLGVGLLWLLEWRRDWRSLAGLTAGSAILVALCFALLPEASRAYLDFSWTVLPDLPNWKEFPLWHLHTIRGFGRLLLPGLPALADGLTFLANLVGVAGFVLLWRRLRGDLSLLFAAAVILSVWITPHAMIYDWAILLIPAVLLWERFSEWHCWLQGRYAWIWLATLVSGSLTMAQNKIGLPVVLQISVPVFVWVAVLLWRRLWAMSSQG